MPCTTGMSINHPKARQIRLPFDVPRPKKSEPTTRVCGICRKNDSKYTCPRCNIPYCSLACFRDQSHAQCSEPFYKTTVMDQIASDPKAAIEEKRRMMEMLRRFEEAQAEGEDAFKELDDEDEGDDELAEKLKDINIDELDSNALFHLLPQTHRDRFLAAIRDPTSETAKELLESAMEGPDEDGERIPTKLPWWEDRISTELDGSEDGSHADPPKMVEEKLWKGIAPAGSGGKLACNAISICLAYTHTLLSFRLPSLSPNHLLEQDTDITEIKTELGRLLPFFIEPKSTIRYQSLREAWTSIWEKIAEESSDQPPTTLLIHLLLILPILLHPPILLGDPPKILLLLSDLYDTYSKPKPGAAIPRKLLFYISALSQLNRGEWLSLEAEVRKEIGILHREGSGEEKQSLEDAAQEVARPALQVD